jgi:CPA1 family monovalent cation:H+ antiporter
MLTYQGRIQAVNVWSTVGFVMNGLIFMLIGLQLPYITRQVERVTLVEAVWYGVAISIVLIITRLCSTIGASLFTQFAGKFITVADRRPGFRTPIVFGWAGMRGVVSLAAALSIPVLNSEGQPFPYRNLILIITFVVILVTLVLQGLTLPWVIKKMRIKDEDARLKEQEQELHIRRTIAAAGLSSLSTLQDRVIPNRHLKNLKTKLETDHTVFSHDLSEFDKSFRRDLMVHQVESLHVLDAQRIALRALNAEDGYDEELIRKYQSILDLEEMKLRELEISTSVER